MEYLVGALVTTGTRLACTEKIRVRIPDAPLRTVEVYWVVPTHRQNNLPLQIAGLTQLVRVLSLQERCHWFESSILHLWLRRLQEGHQTFNLVSVGSNPSEVTYMLVFVARATASPVRRI